MSRKSFIEAQGATCKNWTWSWSFINPKKRIIIFGMWDTSISGQIFDEKWEYNYAGRKNNAYSESVEHIRLVEEEGYTLLTFPIIYSDELKDENGFDPAKIKGFIPKLTKKTLKKVGTVWYASDNSFIDQLPEEIRQPERFVEGASSRIYVNAYERNKKARTVCIRHYGPICSICKFNFKDFYGAIGEGIIHVHHIVSLSEIGQKYELDPIKDLIPVCPNCHAVIHSTQPPLTVEQLKNHLGKSGDE